MREFAGSREALPEGLAGRGAPRLSTGIGGEVPITYAKGSDTPVTRVFAATSRGARGAKLACLPKPRRTITPLFDFGEECVETLASGVFSFGQPGLEQTQKTKSVVHT